MRPAIIVLLLLLVGCARRDLQGLCKLSQDILAEPRIAAGQRFERFRAQAHGFAFSPRTRALLDQLAALTPPERWPRLVEFSRDEVGDGWSCSALREVVGSAQ